MLLIRRGLLLGGLMALSISCSKNKDVFTEYHSIDSLYQSLAPEPISENIDQTQTNTFYSEDGLKVAIGANSLVDGAGQQPDGDVLISYKHLTTVADYLRNDLNTQSQGIVLNVKSMINLRFEHEEDRLQPSEASEGMIQLFVPISQPSAADNLYEWSDSGWRLISEELVETTFDTKIGAVPTTTTGYMVPVQKASWIAIGSPIMNSDSESTLTVTLPENHNSVNSVVYATLVGKSCLLSFDFDNEKSFFYASVGGISTNDEVEIFSITAQGYEDRYDFSTLSVQLATGTRVDLQPSPKSLEDIQSYINSL